jgi:hypothetical protein
MKVYLASITHNNGVNLVAGGSREELRWKLAAYCRAQPLTDWVCAKVPSEEELLTMTDEEVIDTYFLDHPNEYIEEDSDEIKQPVAGGSGVGIDDDYRPKGIAIGAIH